MATLLFADDEPHIRRELEAAADHLRKRGHTVTVVSDGRKALAILQLERPDIVVTDAAMPYVDGFAVIKHARLLHGQRVTIVLLTVLSATGRPARFQGDLIDDYIMKPCHKWQVVLTVDQWLDRLGLSDQELE